MTALWGAVRMLTAGRRIWPFTAEDDFIRLETKVRLCNLCIVERDGSNIPKTASREIGWRSECVDRRSFSARQRLGTMVGRGDVGALPSGASAVKSASMTLARSRSWKDALCLDL